MKKYAFVCIFFSIFLIVFFTTEAGFCSLNIFTHRKINICPVENQSGEEYDYLAESIRTQVYTFALSIPFVTLTDEEREFLKNLSQTDEYREAFSNAGNRITYRLIPQIERDMPSRQHWPINICCSFLVVSEEEIEITIEAQNTMSGERVDSPTVRLPLGTVINNSGAYLTPFFKTLLRYETYTATIDAEPEGSLIFIDGKLQGIGSAEGILLPAGYHRITVKNEGYTDYSDIFSLSEDGFSLEVVLERPEPLRRVSVSSTPEAGVYLDERFLGNTPLDVEVTREPFTITLKRDGYRDAVIHSTDIEELSTKKEAGDAVEIALIPSDIAQARYEDAEKYKKQAKIFSYAGFAMLGATVLFGVEKTLYEQKADLYEGVNQPRSDRARATAKTFSVLTISSAAATGVIFGFSFLRMLKYFRVYAELPPTYEKYSGVTLQYRIGEVQF
jgi:hypothetical protein